MTQTNDEYDFEFFELRKAVLDTVATCARDDDLNSAKEAARNLIKMRGENPEKDASAFDTSFDRAKETVEEDGKFSIEFKDFPSDGILHEHDHDAAIDPTTEIRGDVVEILLSRKQEDGDKTTTIYPIVAHPSGFRVCTCPAQRYYIICPHMLARVIERNWASAPVPA